MWWPGFGFFVAMVCLDLAVRRELSTFGWFAVVAAAYAASFLVGFAAGRLRACLLAALVVPALLLASAVPLGERWSSPVLPFALEPWAGDHWYGLLAGTIVAALLIGLGVSVRRGGRRFAMEALGPGLILLTALTGVAATSTTPESDLLLVAAVVGVAAIGVTVNSWHTMFLAACWWPAAFVIDAAWVLGLQRPGSEPIALTSWLLTPTAWVAPATVALGAALGVALRRRPPRSTAPAATRRSQRDRSDRAPAPALHPREGHFQRRRSA